MTETEQHVCWGCIKGRHATCFGIISLDDLEPDDRGKRCECPICHGNIDVDRKPVFDHATRRYVDPGRTLRIVSTLRVYDPANVLIWQADGHHGDPGSWIPDRTAPADGTRYAIEWRHSGIAFPPGLIPFSVSIQLSVVEQ